MLRKPEKDLGALIGPGPNLGPAMRYCSPHVVLMPPVKERRLGFAFREMFPVLWSEAGVVFSKLVYACLLGVLHAEESLGLRLFKLGFNFAPYLAPQGAQLAQGRVGVLM